MRIDNNLDINRLGYFILFPFRQRPYHSQWFFDPVTDGWGVGFRIETEGGHNDINKFRESIHDNIDAMRTSIFLINGQGTVLLGVVKVNGRANNYQLDDINNISVFLNYITDINNNIEQIDIKKNEALPKNATADDFVNFMLKLLPLFQYSIQDEETRNNVINLINNNNNDIVNDYRNNFIRETTMSLLEKFFNLQKFYFPKEQIFAFYNALKTKGFVILSGLTGTGKTKIAELFIDLIHGSQADSYKCFIPVRADFRDSKKLFGFYNPIEKIYQTTNLLKLIIEATQNWVSNVKRSYFIILDEMNLAHVEYYFAEFLSVIESGRDSEGFTKEAIPLHSEISKDSQGNEIPNAIKLPPNLYVIGTVNIDETTYQFSPKVLDRAFTLEFNEVELENYFNSFEQVTTPFSLVDFRTSNQAEIQSLVNDFTNNNNYLMLLSDKNKIKAAVDYLKKREKRQTLTDINNEVLKKYDLQFGYRVVDEIALFVANNESPCSQIPRIETNAAFDLALKMKILPKFNGNKQKLLKPLVELYNKLEGETLNTENIDYDKIDKAQVNNFNFTSSKIKRMLKDLITKGYASYS